MARKAELEKKVKALEKEVKVLEKEVNVVLKENDKLQVELDLLKQFDDVVDELERDITTGTDLSKDYVVLDGRVQEIVKVAVAKDLVDDIRKRNVTEGQTCLVIDREGA